MGNAVVSRFRRRVVEPTLGVGVPVWVVDPNPDKPQPPSAEPEDTSAADVMAGQLIRNAARLPLDAIDVAAAGMRALVNPLRAGRDAKRYSASLWRVLGDHGATGSPLLAARSLSWRWMAFDLPFADLRAAAKAAGGSVNDAFLSALLGGFRRYHVEMCSPIERMPIAIPVSVRREGDPAGGNRFAGARLARPVGIADPARRIQAIKNLVGAARVSRPSRPRPARARTRTNAGVADLTVNRCARLRVTTCRHPTSPAFAGSRIWLAPRSSALTGSARCLGCATMVTLVSHGETCCIAVNLDPAAVTEPKRFARCLTEGFAEVLALSGGAIGTNPPIRKGLNVPPLRGN